MIASSDRNIVAEPPPLGSERKVIWIGAIGLTLASVGAIAGGVFQSGPGAESWVNDQLAPVRLILSLLGMLVTGAAVTLRPRWIGSWFIASATAAAAGCGIPVSFYTLSFAAFVFAVIAALGAVLAALPFAWRITVVSALPIIHFSGILTAVLSPPPTPQLVANAWIVIYRPYLQFAYLNNAYQFYSPDPGPASEVWFCVEFETRPEDPVQLEELKYNDRGEPLKSPSGQLVYLPKVNDKDEPVGAQVYDAKGNFIFEPVKDSWKNDTVRPIFDEEGNPRYLKKHKWLKLPRRPHDRKDPLFQTYYRRLSLTENVSQATPFSSLPVNVQLDLRTRRLTVTPEANLVSSDKQIPLNEAEWTIDVQFRMPSEQIQDIYMPSYVRHIAKEFQKQEADRRIAGIKVYRVLHMIVRVDYFVGDGERSPYSAFEPTTYLPYFMGDFDANGKLRDPSDPMLFWLVPITRRNDLPFKEFAKPVRTMADYKRLYLDYVSAHAGSNHMEGELEK